MITLDAITLPDDLIWTDEFDWSPVQAKSSYTLTGALIVEKGTKQKGRPITLAGDDNSAWATRATIKALYALMETGAEMTLTLHDARTFTVVFRHADNPIESRPVVDHNNPDDTDYATLIIRLMEV